MSRHPGAFYIPAGLSGAKSRLFEMMAGSFRHTVRDHPNRLAGLRAEVLPVVSCRPGVGPLVRKWQRAGRPFLYWDRGYVCRGGQSGVFRAPGESEGFLRWTLGAVQMRAITARTDARWRSLGVEVARWRGSGGRIVIAEHSAAYAEFHGLAPNWTARTVAKIRRHTDRTIFVRAKESGTPLPVDLRDAHCLVTHASLAAVEAVILGVPVFVAPLSAAAPIGRTDLSMIEDPARPDRRAWLASLAWSQFTPEEVRDGTMWRETVERALA